MTNQELRQKALELAEIHHSKYPVSPETVVESACIFMGFLNGGEYDGDWSEADDASIGVKTAANNAEDK